MDDYSLTMQRWTAHDGQLAKMAWQWSGGRLDDVAMDSLQWGQLSKMDGLAMDSS
jgi:hypothetical protein